jgi:hypothetical protein
VYSTWWHEGGACNLQAARATPPGMQKYLFIMSLEESLVLFLLVRHVFLLMVQFGANKFFFPLFSLFSPEDYNLALLVVDISTSIFFFFIMVILWKFYLFSISLFNLNLLNIIFSNVVLII